MVKLILIISSLIMIGCTPNIIDRDFEKEEADYIAKYGGFAKEDPLWASPSEESMFLTRQDGVTVTIHKLPPDDKEGIMLQNWTVVVNNLNDVHKCVNIVWRLMDFRLVEEHAGYVSMGPKESIVGFVKLKQVLWDMSGVRFALPPSGYIEAMDVRDRSNDNDACEFFENEDDIVEM